MFMVGIAYVPDLIQATNVFNELRASLLADPYFKNVPSMQAAAKKTAIAFHAKDDLPEVRREVFKVLPALGAKVFVAIRRKALLVEEAQALFRYGRKLRPNDVYDDLVKRLFRNLLHKASENQIVFARRGSTLRKVALEDAVKAAKLNFARKYGKLHDVPTLIESTYPSEQVGLQIVDYYLWAVQRLFEAGESRFFDLLAEDYRVVMDVDDKRRKSYGEWYSDANPLTIDKINTL